MSGLTDATNGVCRCCLGVGRFRYISHTYDWLGSKERYADMLQACFNISLSPEEEEEVASLICAVCISRLREAYNFRVQVQRCRLRFINTLTRHGSLHLNRLFAQSPLVKRDPEEEVCSRRVAELHDREDSPGRDTDSSARDADSPGQDADSPGRNAVSPARDAVSPCRDVDTPAGDLILEDDGVQISEQKHDGDTSVGDLKTEAGAEQDSGENYVIAIEIADEDTESKPDIAAIASVRTLRSSRRRKKNQDVDYEPKKKYTKKKLTKKELKTQTTKRHKSREGVNEKSNRQEEERSLKRNAAILISNSEVCPFKCSYNVYRCFYCSTEYDDPAQLRSHTAIEHAKDKYDIYEYIPNNLVYVDVTDLSCGLCERRANDLDDLTNHLIKEHRKSINLSHGIGVIPFRLTTDTLHCYVCNEKFYTHQTLNVHMNDHYRNYVCDVCNAAYVTRNRLAKHAATHKKGSHKCSHCDKVFETNTKLRCHIDIVHENKAKSVCRICGIRFKDYDQKMLHLVRFHNQTPQQYKCQYCDKVYVTRRALMNHTRRDHFKVRNHKCEFCEKTFYLKSQYDQHIVVHTGETNFECNVCEKRFNRKVNLTTHMAIHTGVRPYSCNICNAEFITASHLKWHKKTNHKDDLLYY